jgi:hypothetical protein
MSGGRDRDAGILRHPTEEATMAGLGQLTIRFTSGESWSMPFVGRQAQELSKALEGSPDEHQWITLLGPGDDESDQILMARCGTIESILWVEKGGQMQEAASGELGKDFADSDED